MVLGNMTNRSMRGISFHLHKAWFVYSPIGLGSMRGQQKGEGRGSIEGLGTLVPPGLLNDAL